MVDQGIGLQDKQMKKALANVEKMEEVFFATVGKAVQGAGGTVQGPWEQVLKGMKLRAPAPGGGQRRPSNSWWSRRSTRLARRPRRGLRAPQAMLDSYAALVSGVLIGMSTQLPSEAVARQRPHRSRDTQGRR